MSEWCSQDLNPGLGDSRVHTLSQAAKGLAKGFAFLWDFIKICSTSGRQTSHQRVEIQTEAQQTLDTQRATESPLGRSGWEGFKVG